MARLRFEDGMFTLVDGSITARFDVDEGDLKDVRDFLLERYPLEAAPEPEPGPGIYITKDRKMVLFNDGDIYNCNWSKIKPIEFWSAGCRWADWDVVVSEIGQDSLPLTRIEDTGILADSDEHGN